MLETIVVSVFVSTVVWGIIWNFSRILKKTMFSSWVDEPLSESKIGNVWTSPTTGSSGMCSYDYDSPICESGIFKGNCCKDNINSANPKKDEFADLLKDVEETNETKIIFINHRSRSSDLLGLSLPFIGENFATLSRKDAIEIIDILREIPDDMSLDIILNTTGGSMTAAEIIINALHNRSGVTRFYIPHYAQSAGLLLALAGDDIYLGKNAFVSPVDPQLGYGISAASVKRFCDARARGASPGEGWVGDLMRLIYGEAQAAVERTYNLIEKMLIRNSDISAGDIEIVQEELASGKYNHDKPLFFQDLNKIVKNVHPTIPDDIFRLYELHNKK